MKAYSSVSNKDLISAIEPVSRSIDKFRGFQYRFSAKVIAAPLYTSLADKIDLASQNCLQLCFHSAQVEQGGVCRFIEFDQNVNIAIGPEVLAQGRAKDGEAYYAICSSEFGNAIPRDGQVSIHAPNGPAPPHDAPLTPEPLSTKNWQLET